MTLPASRSRKTKIAIMASGSGTNAENIMEYAKDHSSLEVACIITDKFDAGVIDRAKNFDVPVVVIPLQKGDERDKSFHRMMQEIEIIKVLRMYDVEWICLAGYMRILSKQFLNHFYDQDLDRARVINVHPSLLPDFPGINSYKRAFEAEVDKGGVTIHFVDEGMDTGSHIVQKSFPRDKGDDLDSFVKKGMELEYKMYREVLGRLTENKMSLVRGEVYAS